MSVICSVMVITLALLIVLRRYRQKHLGRSPQDISAIAAAVAYGKDRDTDADDGRDDNVVRLIYRNGRHGLKHWL